MEGGATAEDLKAEMLGSGDVVLVEAVFSIFLSCVQLRTRWMWGVLGCKPSSRPVTVGKTMFTICIEIPVLPTIIIHCYREWDLNEYVRMSVRHGWLRRTWGDGAGRKAQGGVDRPFRKIGFGFVALVFMSSGYVCGVVLPQVV